MRWTGLRRSRRVRPGDGALGGGQRLAGAPGADAKVLTGYARLDFLAGLRVVSAELGGDAGLVGAAALAGLSREP